MILDMMLHCMILPRQMQLYDMLPLELTFEDFNHIEKIAYLDKKLPTKK